MMISERIQSLIHSLEVGVGTRLMWGLVGLLSVAGLTVLYDLNAYHGFSSPEAMDAAQVARNVSEGRGFTTEFIRPFSVHLVQKHNRAAHPELMLATNATDFAKINSRHPDLANPPFYPLTLATLLKIWTPQWKAEVRKPFWSEGGSYRRYQPEFHIAIFNQVLLLAMVVLAFFITRKLFDLPAAVLVALLTLGSDVLWKFSVSGLSTMLVMVIFLGLVWCICKIEEIIRQEEGLIRSENLIILGEAEKNINLGGNEPARQSLRLKLQKRQISWAIAAGVMVGLGMLTRYSFGWLIVPTLVYLVLFGGSRRTGLAVTTFLTFAFLVSPWIVRNIAVSGTPFGTAGFAVFENTSAFAGTKLMQSLNPDMTGAYYYSATIFAKKLLENSRYIFPGELLYTAGGWLMVLFLAGLMLGIRNVAARRLRYFTMMCLGVLVLAQAAGRTQMSFLSPEMNSENLLVLLTPMIFIFGVVFFLTLLNQMNMPSPQVRVAVMALLVAIACQPFVATLLPPKVSPVIYPPYYPPDIQKISGWMRTDELLMSDVPWAVAWYGDRQCSWTTINSQYEFFQLNDYIKPVHGLYLTLNTLDAKLFTECLQGGVDSWGNFVLKTVAANQIPPQFPLRSAPYGLASGLFLTDRQRWLTE
jgi:hypothetical protein